MIRVLPKITLTGAVALSFLLGSSSRAQMQMLDLRAQAVPANSAEFTTFPLPNESPYAATQVAHQDDLTALPTSVEMTQDQPRNLAVEAPGGLVNDDVAAGTAMAETYGDGMYVEEGWGGGMPGEYYGCGGCPSYFTASTEFLFLSRDGLNSSLSNSLKLGQFDYEPGYRVSIGHKSDCLDGWEFTWVGPYQWLLSDSVTGTGMNPTFGSDASVDISGFQNAVFQSQAYESKLNSIELSKKWWGWDVIVQSLGMRYLNLAEEYNYASRNAANVEALYIQDTNNHAIGVQYGLDLLYPVGDHWILSSRSRIGAYGNFANSNTLLVNDGVTQINNEADEAQLAVLGEVGVYAHCRVTHCVTIKVGYEGWYLYGVAKASGQTPGLFTAATGKTLNTDEDLILHGLNGGVEVVW